MNCYTMEFWQEMVYLGSIYGWSPADRDEIRAWVKASTEAMRWCTWLAQSWHAAGRGEPMVPFDLWEGK